MSNKKIKEEQNPLRHTDQHNQNQFPDYQLPHDWDNKIEMIEEALNKHRLAQLHKKLAALVDYILAKKKKLMEEVELEVPLEELILDYLKNTSSIKGCVRRELFIFLTIRKNLSALIFMQIIYDRAPLGLLPELVQVSFNILIKPCHPINIYSMKPNQIDSFANDIFFQQAFADTSLNFLRLQKGTQKSKDLMVGSQALLELIRIFAKCLLLAINTQFPKGIKEDQIYDEELSSEPKKKVKKDPD